MAFYRTMRIAPATAVAATATNKVKLALQVPADAEVYLAGQKMTISGTNRMYVTPALEAGKTFQYPIRVVTNHAGQSVEVSAIQPIRAGETIQLVVQVDGAGQLQIAQKPGQNIQQLVKQPAAGAQLTAQK